MTKGHETKPKISFGLISHFARVHSFEEERREPRGGREGRRRRRRSPKIKVCCLRINIFWIPRALVRRIDAPLV